MPCKTRSMKCSVCGKTVRGSGIATLRRHYQRQHPRKFKQWGK